MFFFYTKQKQSSSFLPKKHLEYFQKKKIKISLLENFISHATENDLIKIILTGKLPSHIKKSFNSNIKSQKESKNIIQFLKQPTNLLEILLHNNKISIEIFLLFKNKKINAGFLSDFQEVLEKQNYEGIAYAISLFAHLLSIYTQTNNLDLINVLVDNLLFYFCNDTLGMQIIEASLTYLMNLKPSNISPLCFELLENIIKEVNQYDSHYSEKIQRIRDFLYLKVVYFRVQECKYSSESLSLFLNLIHDVNFHLDARKQAGRIYNKIIEHSVPQKFYPYLIINIENL